jgi:hypothetical protein
LPTEAREVLSVAEARHCDETFEGKHHSERWPFMARIKSDIRQAFDNLAPNFVRVSRTGFVLDGHESSMLRGRILEDPCLVSKLFEDGKLIDASEDGRSIRGARSFLRVRLETRKGVLTLDLSPASARNLLDFEEKLTAQGLSLGDRDVELRVVDKGKWFHVQFQLAADQPEPEIEKERAF